MLLLIKMHVQEFDPRWKMPRPRNPCPPKGNTLLAPKQSMMNVSSCHKTRQVFLLLNNVFFILPGSKKSSLKVQEAQDVEVQLRVPTSQASFATSPRRRPRKSTCRTHASHGDVIWTVSSEKGTFHGWLRRNRNLILNLKTPHHILVYFQPKWWLLHQDAACQDAESKMDDADGYGWRQR